MTLNQPERTAVNHIPTRTGGRAYHYATHPPQTTNPELSSRTSGTTLETHERAPSCHGRNKSHIRTGHQSDASGSRARERPRHRLLPRWTSLGVWPSSLRRGRQHPPHNVEARCRSSHCRRMRRMAPHGSHGNISAKPRHGLWATG